MTASRILVVDDVPVNIRALAELLAPYHDVRVATSGADAIAAAQDAEAPDLILLDVIMPEMDGYETCRRLKSDPATRDIPIIFITSKAEVEDETQGFDLGAADYITKPFDGKVVLARVRAHLALKHRFDRLRADMAATAPPSRQANVFRKSGDVWTVCYLGGREFHLADSKGAAYLALLLAHPNRAFRVEDLVYHLSPDPVVLVPGDAGATLDQQALRQYRDRMADLRDRLDDAERHNDAETARRMRQELDWLAEELAHSGPFGRHVRKAASDRERFRKSVGNAIRRTLADILQVDPALALHLSHPRLRLGYGPIYEPGGPVTWEVG